MFPQYVHQFIYPVPSFNSKTTFHRAEKCPMGSAWADIAIEDDVAHAPAVCSNRGSCDTRTGQCQCEPGYEGASCSRSMYLPRLITTFVEKVNDDFVVPLQCDVLMSADRTVNAFPCANMQQDSTGACNSDHTIHIP